MNTAKTISLTIAGIIAIVISLLIIQLLTKKLRQKAILEGRFKPSYAIWFSFLFIAASIVMSKSMGILNEAIDNIFKIELSGQVINILKTGSLLIGFGAVWLLIWYYIAGFLSVTIVGKRIAATEMDADNYAYFLIKGVLLVGFILILSTIFETVLRAFIPNVQLPFYH